MLGALGGAVVIKGIAAAGVAAVVAAMGVLTRFGTPLIQAVVAIVAGVLSFKFFKGMAFIGTGLIMAGGLILANTYLVPIINRT